MPLRLVLTGAAMAFGFQAVMSLIVYFVPDGESTSTVLFWSMGGFGAATWGALPVVAVSPSSPSWCCAGSHGVWTCSLWAMRRR